MKKDTIKDGLGISIAFANYPDLFLSIDPISITPPANNGGDGIPTTSHSNDTFRTKHPRTLVDVENMRFVAAYDPDAWDDIVDAVNKNQLITLLYPTGDSLAIWGYLKSFLPKEFVEGVQPEADCEIVVTNVNDSGVETGPSVTEASS